MNYKTVHEKKDNQLEVLTCHWTCQETVVQTLVTFSVSTGCIYRGRKCDILDLDWPVISVLISALYICSTWADRWKTSVKPAPRGHFLCTFCLYSLFVSQVELFLHLKASCAEGLLFPMSRCAGDGLPQTSKIHTLSAICRLRMFCCDFFLVLVILSVEMSAFSCPPQKNNNNVVFSHRNHECYCL